MDEKKFEKSAQKGLKIMQKFNGTGSRDHFEGKSVVEHLKETRAKGTLAVAEIHGTEISGHISAGADAAKETAVLLLLLWTLFSSLKLFLIFSAALLLWKTGRSALLGWARLERLHRLIEEERWEIEHNREQEKEELTAMYRAKGLTGKLLDETIAVLMSDDNRLLRIMLEEEMGLTLEVYEHPLKQAAGAAFGVAAASALFFAGCSIDPFYGPLASGALTLAAAAIIAARAERNRLLEAVIWNLSLGAFAAGTAYLLKIL